MCTSTGQWSNEPPYCQCEGSEREILLYIFLFLVIIHQVDCGRPPSVPAVPHLTVSTSNGTIANSIATYSCESGYTLLGTIYSACQVDGVWSDITEPQRCISEFSAGFIHFVKFFLSHRKL